MIEEVLSLGLVRSRPKEDEEPPPSSCIIVVLMMDEPKFIPPHQISPLRMAQNYWHPGSHAPRVISSWPPSSPNTWRLPKISIHFPSELEQEMLSQRAVHPSRICWRNLLSACHFLLMDNGSYSSGIRWPHRITTKMGCRRRGRHAWWRLTTLG